MSPLAIPQATRRPWSVRLLRLALTTGVAGLGVFAVLWLATWWIPLPEALLHPAEETLLLEDSQGRELAVLPTPRARASERVTWDELGPWLPAITVALEDKRFWSHNGVDAKALAGALCRNLRQVRVISGASTLAQQLIKATRPRTRWRLWDKVYETLAAVRLTRQWTREHVLVEYLNRVDFGNRRLGVKAAARAYFDKAPAALTFAEAVYLAGLPQAPTRFNPWRRPEAAARRYERCLQVLEREHVLTPARAEFFRMSLPAVQPFAPLSEAPHFVDALLRSHPGLHGRTRTTLDLNLQHQVETLVSHHVQSLSGKRVSQAAVVVLDNRDGSVRALVGSAGYDVAEGQYNGALLPRSAGSVLKPFLYLQALENRRLTAATVLPDTPDALRSDYVDYDPKNFDENYLGPVRVREALANSLNVPAVHVLSLVGARSFYDYLKTWGLRFPRGLEHYGAGLILGNAEPRLLDVAAAYAGLASQGRVPTWRLLESEPKISHQVATPEATAIVADILCDDEARRLTFGRGSPLAVPVRVPCKTGTSSGFRDAWTVGSTAQHTVAVWAGNFDGQPMDAVASIEAAAPLWREVVELLLASDSGVPEPQNPLVSREVCRLSGLVPCAQSPGTIKEWFLPGTEPRASASTWWVQEKEGASRLVLPAAFATWCISPFNTLGAGTPEAAELQVTYPHDGGRLSFDPDLPAVQQTLSFEATPLQTSTEPLHWEVDGQPLAQQNGLALWPLIRGEHEAVVTQEGHRATVHFSVQ